MENDYQSTAFIITAVVIETESVKKLYSGWKRITVPGDSQIYYETFFERDGKRHRIVTAQQNVMGMTAATVLTMKAIQEFLNGRSDRSRKTLQELLTLLKAILESARKDRLIEFNPADDRRLRIPSDKKTERKALSMEDEKDILANISKLQKQDQRFLALLIYTGMRRGEILGLMWDDIDLEENVIYVRRNVTYPSGQNDPLVQYP